jgi:hypothetical protein
MFEFIDSLGLGVEMLAVFALGWWLGKRTAAAKLQAKCDARNCDTIKQMRKERMEISAENMKITKAHDTIRRAYLQAEAANHSLRTSKGMMAKEIQTLTYQLPRQQRRMVN